MLRWSNHFQPFPNVTILLVQASFILFFLKIIQSNHNSKVLPDFYEFTGKCNLELFILFLSEMNGKIKLISKKEMDTHLS